MEIGLGVDAYRCELNGVSHEITGNYLLMGTPFTQGNDAVPFAFALYARTFIVRTLPQLKLKLGFGIWKHIASLHFDGLNREAGTQALKYVKADLNFRIHYLQIPLSLEYQYDLSSSSSLVFNAGAVMGIRVAVYDNYNDITNSLVYYGTDVIHNRRNFIQPQVGLGYQYRYKRHKLSVSPFFRFGSYDVIERGQFYPAGGFYYNLKDATWRTPYGVSVQYFFTLSKV